MVFSSLTFLYVFLPLTLGAAFLAPAKWRNGVLLLASLGFFAWGAPRFVFALVASCLFDYLLSLGAARGGLAWRGASLTPKALCAAGVAANLLLLGYFKYSNFAVDQLNAALALLGLEAAHWTRVALPLGISFFTFQKISYLVDVRRGTAKPAANFGRYLLYIVLFPQLVLGPIIRYHDIADQFEHRRATAEGFLSGLWRFALGLARKTLVAGPLAILADAAFAQSGAGLAPRAAWLGLYAYTLQLYFDFAGYCDMAVGLGRMLGFRFPENFDAPYVSRDMAEFWRRWHMTLGAFMKEYLYIPLGGNRRSKARCLFNNWLVFLVSGFWHGASWNFLVWGAWHGLWIMVAKLRRAKRPPRLAPRHAPAALATLLLVMVGWVFFRAETFGAAARYLSCLFPLPPPGAPDGGTAAVLAALTAPRTAAMAAGTILSFAPALLPSLGLMNWDLPETASAGAVFLRTAATALLLLLATLPLLASGFNPFIYFRF